MLMILLTGGKKDVGSSPHSINKIKGIKRIKKRPDPRWCVTMDKEHRKLWNSVGAWAWGEVGGCTYCQL